MSASPYNLPSSPGRWKSGALSPRARVRTSCSGTAWGFALKPASSGSDRSVPPVLAEGRLHAERTKKRAKRIKGLIVIFIQQDLVIFKATNTKIKIKNFHYFRFPI